MDPRLRRMIVVAAVTGWSVRGGVVELIPRVGSLIALIVTIALIIGMSGALVIERVIARRL